MEADREFWLQLLSHGQYYFPHWYDDLLTRQWQACVKTIDQWWQLIEAMPRSLIHGDFNPRNIAFRRDTAGCLQLVAYDWELAMLHLPQRDCVELLAFVLLPHQVNQQALHFWSELQRRALQQACGNAVDSQLDSKQWWLGFCLAICDFAVNRFGLYLVGHTAKEYVFMERLAATTFSMFRLAWRYVEESLCLQETSAPHIPLNLHSYVASPLAGQVKVTVL
jgi:hypothetical protein